MLDHRLRLGSGRGLPGYDPLVQALSGLMSITGPADGEASKVGVALVDVIAGLGAAVAILVPGGSPGEIVDHLTDVFLEAFVANRQAAQLLYRHILEPIDARVVEMFTQLQSFAVGVLAEHGTGARIDPQAMFLIFANAFLAAVVDEAGDKIALGESIYSSRAARERLRAELRRIGRAVLGVRRQIFLAWFGHPTCPSDQGGGVTP